MSLLPPILVLAGLAQVLYLGALGWLASGAFRRLLAEPTPGLALRPAPLLVSLGAGATSLGAFVGSVALELTGWSGVGCGAGVMQAMGPSGSTTLVLQCGALLAGLAAWETRGRGDLASRLLLAWLPLALVGAWHGVQAVMAVRGAPPVHSCGVAMPSTASPGLILPFLPLLWGGGAGLAVLALALARWPVWPLRAALLAATLVWSAGLASAVRGEPHVCAWCLLLPSHQGLGFIWLVSGAFLVQRASAVAWRSPPPVPSFLVGLLLAAASAGLAWGGR